MASVPSSTVNTQVLSSTAEDAAGEGGEAVATFANYVAPSWAKIMAKNPIKSSASEGGSHTETKRTNARKKDDDCNDIIVLDCTDDESEQEDDVPKKNTDTDIDLDPRTSNDYDTLEIREQHQDDIPSHSSPACESGLLASVHAPEPSAECLQIVRQLGEEGKLSPLQMEGVGLAIQRHCRLLKKEGMSSTSITSTSTCSSTASELGGGRHVRAGFFLGDGAGIGKGRQIAAVLRDSLSRSVRAEANMKFSQTMSSRRRRHLWISVSRELIEDARRDLQDIGCYVPVIDGAEALGGNSHNKGLSSNEGSGVMFVTYAFLVTGKGKRMNDIIAWLVIGNGSSATNESDEASFDGCIIFDEAHKAKNLCADPPTITGLLVRELQERLSNARVMYCSATGVSSIKQMGYATRLGLWGEGTNFPTFDDFCSSLEKRGVGAMELLALEMKQAGCFVARTLSWDGAEFDTIKVQLSEEQRVVYDRSMLWWQYVKMEIKAALDLKDMNRTPKMLWSQYWSAIQRFAKELAICAKVPSVANSALQQINRGHSVVIGLQSTGEASALASLEELQAQRIAQNLPVQNLEDLSLPHILSTAAAIMAGFVRNHFPVAPLPPEPIKVPPIPPGGFTSENDRIIHQHMSMLAEQAMNAPLPVAKPELLQKRENLLNAINKISLPPSPLDDLIDRLGGVDNVAEMTGRSGRILRSKTSSKFKYKRRIGVSKESRFGLSMPCSQEDSDRLNIVEKKKFMDGTKMVAIISDAASTGISLHAAMGSGACTRRRVHYTIELPWAADKAIQQLGRSHRSGQLSAPIYKMVVTDLGGERRFAAAVAKRMAGLGALTKGDRRAATGSDLSEFDIDSRFGRRSLKRFYDCMISEPPYAPSKTSNVILDSYVSNLKDTNELPSQIMTQADRRLYALGRVKLALDMIGIEPGSDARKNGDVKVFLNRIAALAVMEQNLVFQLFISTMEDVISEAKVTGEFQQSVEEIRATSIELSCKPDVLTVDRACGATTKLAIFDVDRGCSLSNVCETCLNLITPFFLQEQPIEANGSVALSGFYLSKREIMGRKLVLFARRKIQISSDEAENENMIDFDPQGLMVLTRPNTGTNPCEMSTNDLCRKYRLVASIDDVKKLLQKESSGASSNPPNLAISPDDLLNLFSQNHESFSTIWRSAYESSNNYDGDVGLAPRRAKISMVTGSVLHCLPVLEKSVASMAKLSERSLKIVRVEVSSNHQRFVGIKFPMNDGALESLRISMATMAQQKISALALNDDKFMDETPDSIQEKSISWLTSAPVTMKTFFKTSHSTEKRKAPDKVNNVNSRSSTTLKKARRQTTKQAKATSITSFFSKI